VIDGRAGPPRKPGESERLAAMTTNTRWTLISIVVLSILLDYIFFTGFFASDDQQYFHGALKALRGSFLGNSPSHGEMRLTIVGWNAIVITLLGPNVQLVAASYVLWHQLLNLATFAVGRRVANVSAGLLAAFLSATAPAFIIYSTMILPDIPLALFILLSFLAFYEAYHHREKQQTHPAASLMFLAGICVGLAYAAKETGLILLPFYFFLWLALECRLAGGVMRDIRLHNAGWRGLCFALGVLAVVLDETAILSLLDARFLVRLGWTFEDMSAARVERIQQLAGLDPLARLERVRAVLDQETFLPGILKVLLLFGLVAYPFMRRRSWSLYVLPIWMFTYLTWGSMNFSRYVPPTIKSRYYLPVLPFLFIVASVPLCRVWASIASRIPPGHARSTFRLVGLCAIVLMPLLWLRGPNRLAGTYSRADIVGPAVRAVNQTLATSARPIVLSHAVWRATQIVLQAHPYEQLIPADDVTPELLHGLAQHGGFDYIEFGEHYVFNRKNRFVAPAALDEIIHALCHERSYAISNGFPWGTPILGSSLEKAYASQFQIGECGFAVRERTTLRNPSDRLSAIRAVLGREIIPRATPEPGSGVTIYSIDATQVSTRPAPWLPDHQVGPIQDLTPQLKRWRVYRAKECEVVEAHDGAPTVIARLSPGEHAWYHAPRVDRKHPWQLNPGPRWQIITQITLQGGVDLELWLDFYADRECKQHVTRKRVRIQDGANQLGVWPATRPTFVRPTFRIAGTGRFSVKHFAFVSCE
jgi:hypothetical protein